MLLVSTFDDLNICPNYTTPTQVTSTIKTKSMTSKQEGPSNVRTTSISIEEPVISSSQMSSCSQLNSLENISITTNLGHLLLQSSELVDNDSHSLSD